MSLTEESIADAWDFLDATLAGAARDHASRAARVENRTWLHRHDDKPCTWPEIREYVLTEAHHICAICAGPATEADHIWPKRWGGQDYLENLQALCTTCNKTKGVSLDHVRASSHELIMALHVPYARLHADINNTLVEIANEMINRVTSGDLPRTAAVSALSALADSLAGAAEGIRQWAAVAGATEEPS